MNRQHRLSLVATAILLGLSSFQLQAQTQFDQVIVFGASYLDSGTFADPLTGGTTGLRFTNNDPITGDRGSSLAELLTSDLGLGELLPALATGQSGRVDNTANELTPDGNINFAVGGFQTGDIAQSVSGPGAPIIGGLLGVQESFTSRLASGSLTISENSLFLLNLGGNDIRAEADPAATAETSLEIIQTLVDAGAQNIVALNLPRLGELAEGSNVDLTVTDPTASNRTTLAENRTAGALEFNALVDAGLSSIDANIIRADVATLFDEVLADPTGFGFSADINQTSQCFNSAEVFVTGIACIEPAGGANDPNGAGNPDDFIFNDGLHPTQRTAQITADYIESLLRAPGQISLISESGFQALAQHQSSLRSELSVLRFSSQEVKSYRFFTNINDSSDNIDQTSTTFSAENDSTTGNIGFAYKYNPQWTLGLALGYIDQDVDIDSTGTSFENDGFLISGLAAYQKGKLFAEATVTFADLDIESDRGVLLGINQRIESGDTDGDGIGITLTAGYDLLSSKKWRAGPIARLDYNDFDVDSFSEDGARSTSLSFSNIERDSLIASLGAFANVQSSWGNIPVQYFGEFTFESDLAGRPDNIRVSLNSLSNNAPSFELDSINIDSSGVAAQLGISATLNKSTTAQLSYNYRNIGGSLNAVNLGLNVDF